ncbi:MAG: hypothetical protein IJ489_02800 [Clostridia bacterium]|nr:hypothetical protein [Clostridia bacterium]
MTEKTYQKEDCVLLLQEKYEELRSQGIERYPKRSDFSEREIVAIKAFLGPWPRALEAAAIKPPRDDGKAEKNKEKRIRTKRAQTERKKEALSLKKHSV